MLRVQQQRGIGGRRSTSTSARAASTTTSSLPSSGSLDSRRRCPLLCCASRFARVRTVDAALRLRPDRFVSESISVCKRDLSSTVFDNRLAFRRSICTEQLFLYIFRVAFNFDIQ